jgi:spore maturation protein CgeB
MVESAPQMRRALRDVLEEPQLAAWLSEQGRRTILARHTCAHRVDELLAIHRSLQAPPVAVNLNVGAV